MAAWEVWIMQGRISEEEQLLVLWFNNIEGMGYKTQQNLLIHFGCIEEVYYASDKVIEEVLGSIPGQKRITIPKDMDRIRRLKDKMDERGIWFVYPGHKKYPDKLLNIYEPPQILYIKGRLKESLGIYNNNVGIVGSRNPSVYGKEMARMFARELAVKGMCIVSGLAMGIDGMAHLGALDADGYTIGVLGCAINVIYPRENIELYRRIEETGAIISEYAPDAPTSAGTFPRRNRIISGLSDGVMVVEARKKSGSLITADLALEQGKQVYALPGRAYDINSEGTNRLIKMGAMCVTSPEDIIMDLNGGNDTVINKDCDIDVENAEKISDKNYLAPIEKMVYSCLSLEPMYIDDIIQKLGIGITKAISTLYILEEKGVIKQPLKGYYIVAI